MINYIKFTNVSILVYILTFTALGIKAQVNIIPEPYSMTVGGGSFTVPSTIIINSDVGSDTTVSWVMELFKQAGIQTKTGNESSAHIILKIITNPNLGTEGYLLEITADKITIEAPMLTGQFYAVQTLRQMMPPEIELRDPNSVPKPITLSQLQIEDKPRFEYRSSMIDQCRHWIPREYLYQHADRMALFKLNTLHLHLSEDQGWRIEVPDYPKLLSVGAQTQIGGANPPAGEHWYWTQEEMAHFIKYCADRKITIIPEIDMPGHAIAAIASYPQLSATGNTNAVSTTEGVKDDYLKVGDPFTEQFITDVLTSLTALFPSEYFHIGGDECHSTTISDYAAFIRWVEQLVKNLGKKMVGWEEIGQTYLGQTVYQEPTTRVQRWHKSGQGHVVSWCDKFYLDMKNKSSDDNMYSLSWCGIVTLQVVYSTNFSGAGPDCIGFEAPYWTERCRDVQNNTDLAVADEHIWPRLAALADITWVKNNNNWNGFRERLAPYGSRFNLMGVEFYDKDAAISWETSTPNPDRSSVFDGFVPTSTVTPVIPNLQESHFTGMELSGKHRLYDMQGRLLGAFTAQNLLGGGNRAAKIGKGVYFLVNEKSFHVKRFSIIK